MYIHLKWKNVNSQDVTINLYRSTTTIDRNNPGTPLITLPGSATEYVDNTVVKGTTYYYVIQFVNGNSKMSSNNYAFLADYKRGPGNNVVMCGTDDYGFMGYGSWQSLNQLLTGIGVGRETTTPTNDLTVTYYKFSVDGAVYYSLFVSMQYVNAANMLAFSKRQDPLHVVFDGLSYLAFIPNFAGADWVRTDYSSGKKPMGDRSLATKLILPCLNNNSLRGIPGEELGCVDTQSSTNYYLSKSDPDATSLLSWYPANDSMYWAAAPSNSWISPVTLKLVE